MYEIYKITNVLNKKNYIGITSRGIEVRFKEHLAAARYGKDKYPFHSALKKYGEENFKIEVIDTCDTIEQARLLECKYIKIFHSYIQEDGYNATLGGDINAHLCGENSPRAKIDYDDFLEIKEQLETTNLFFKEIAEKIPGCSEKMIDEINRGLTWYNDTIEYPIRKNGKSISKIGEHNPASKLKEEQVIEIISLLKNTKESQALIAKKFNVHYNTICYINTCRIWKHLHSYNFNIRLESRKK